MSSMAGRKVLRRAGWVAKWLATGSKFRFGFGAAHVRIGAKRHNVAFRVVDGGSGFTEPG